VIANLAPQYVKFPFTVPERSMTVHDFYAIAAFPGVLGAVDCTHVPIQSPGGNHAELFEAARGIFRSTCRQSRQLTSRSPMWFPDGMDLLTMPPSLITARFETGEFRQRHLLGDA